jgi:hypothetical protein
MKRSIAMLTPGQAALRREEALVLLDELEDVEVRLERLKQALRHLADDA